MCKIDKYIHQICITNDHTPSTDHAKKKEKGKKYIAMFIIHYLHISNEMSKSLHNIRFFLEMNMSLCRWTMSDYYTSPVFLSPCLSLDLSQGQGLQTVRLTAACCWESSRPVACCVFEEANLLESGTMFLKADGSPCLQTEFCESGTCVLEAFWTLSGSLTLDDMQGRVRRWRIVSETEASSPWESPSSDRKRAALWRHEEKPSTNWCFSSLSTSFALAWATEFCRNRTVYSRISAFSSLLCEGLWKSKRRI